MLSVNCFYSRRFHEQIPLWSFYALIVDAEGDGEWLAEDDRPERREKLAILRVVPVGGELIRGNQGERLSVESRRLQWFEPDTDDLFGEFRPCSFEQPVPHFGGRERHHRLGYFLNVEKSISVKRHIVLHALTYLQ